MPNKVHNADIKLFLMCSKCCLPVNPGGWELHKSVTRARGHHHQPANKIELLPYVVAMYSQSFLYTYIPVRPYIYPPIQAAQLQLHLDTSLVLVILYSPRYPRLIPLSPHFIPDPAHIFQLTCWTFVTVRLVVHQEALAAVRLTHNLQNNLHSLNPAAPVELRPCLIAPGRPFSQSLSQPGWERVCKLSCVNMQILLISYPSWEVL